MNAVSTSHECLMLLVNDGHQEDIIVASAAGIIVIYSSLNIHTTHTLIKYSLVVNQTLAKRAFPRS